MIDEVSRILLENRVNLTSEPEELPVLSIEEFNEEAYLNRNPDVADCVSRGVFLSGYEHYKNFGRFESRALFPSDTGPRDKIVFSSETRAATLQLGVLGQVSIDALLMTPAGGIMIIGWADDAADPIDYIIVGCLQWKLTISSAALVRVRRQDAEAALESSVPNSYGFFCLHFEPGPISVPVSCELVVVMSSGRSVTIVREPKSHSDFGLRDVVLSYLAEAQFFSNYQLEAIAEVGRGFGKQVLLLNRSITKRFTANPYIERFGVTSKPIKGSIIVCLYGRAEYLFLQGALFSRLPGIDDYEFIYVSNSPELGEVLLREAKLAAGIYDHRITVVLLEGNAGFGAANNAAASAAQSGRILIVNPDVFPHDPEWALKHTLLIQDRPTRETRIFGAPLYYDDGSLMHGGMYFELDSGVLLRHGMAHKLDLVRVEHYGKGAPSSITHFTEPRRVPAITGAFMSSDRAWFEKLNGFTEDYVFGHYEDADLCLKSMTLGVMPWMHNLRLWHLEGKGSTRRPVHEGGTLINRWLFSSRWSALINHSLLGPRPDLDKLETAIEAARREMEQTSVSDEANNKMALGGPTSVYVLPLDRDEHRESLIGEHPTKVPSIGKRRTSSLSRRLSAQKASSI